MKTKHEKTNFLNNFFFSFPIENKIDILLLKKDIIFLENDRWASLQNIEIKSYLDNYIYGKM